MRRGRWLGGLGAILAGAVVVALLYSRPAPTRFESGYGLRLVGRRASGRGGLRAVTRYYASPEGFDAVARRLDHELGPSAPMEGMRIWSVGSGLVAARSSRPLSAPDGGWPDGTATFLTTFEVSSPTLLQRAARAMGIRL